jgi:hypothetical protein
MFFHPSCALRLDFDTATPNDGPSDTTTMYKLCVCRVYDRIDAFFGKVTVHQANYLMVICDVFSNYVSHRTLSRILFWRLYHRFCVQY